MDIKKDLSHRTAKVKIKITDSKGNPIINQEVAIEQINHKFLFGCAGFDSIPLANGEFEGHEFETVSKRYDKFFNLFNFVTLPFYWGRFEPERGKPDTDRLKRASEWLVSKGVTVKGHPLCWHTVTAPWLMELSNEEILKTQLARIDRDVSDFKGIIDMWDVINEVVIMPIFDKYDNGITRISKDLGRIGIVREMFAASKKANPDATLLINDFNTSINYEILIEGCLEAGIPIDAIGIQSHMHQGYWGVEKTHEVLERFSHFGLPIHFTENTLVSGHIMPPEIEDLNDYQLDAWPTTPEGEKRQAEEITTHFKTLFEHPQVESITLWNFTDDAWLNAPAGLLRADDTMKPSYYALESLIKDKWWSGKSKVTTDAAGVLEFEGFLGGYEAEFSGKKRKFSLDKGKKIAKISF